MEKQGAGEVEDMEVRVQRTDVCGGLEMTLLDFKPQGSILERLLLACVCACVCGSTYTISSAFCAHPAVSLRLQAASARDRSLR